ncbi:unnamed protein product [Thelazia callipaeda]|uniref:Nucleolar complex protein 2 homolog n=1 Tax=Thelazia callipaeda TaxID=103827 RepID=A0A0N5CM99_THECL|nr:unnamed protein product [Thelazia callipaeda]
MTDIEDANQENMRANHERDNALLLTCARRKKSMKKYEEELISNGLFSVRFKPKFIVAENTSLSVHRKELLKLAEKDPGFYKFLKEEESDLLAFRDLESGSDKDSDSEVNKEEKRFFEEKNLLKGNVGRKIIDQSFVENLQNCLLETSRPKLSLLREVVAAFTACVARVGANIELPNYIVNDSDVFESIIRLCFSYLGKCLHMLIGEIRTEPSEGATDLRFRQVGRLKGRQYKRWKKYSSLLKSYFHALTLFLNEIQTPDVIVCTLRAITDLLELYIKFPKLIRNLTKILVRIWSRRTLECRCAAFFAVYKLVRISKSTFSSVIKSFYFGYVTSARDVSAESWCLVAFMQKSFAELCLVYPEVSYQYTFVYIRQTAIHLRNAVIAKRKVSGLLGLALSCHARDKVKYSFKLLKTDLIQTVYNWQFIRCLYLWTQVIGKAHRLRISSADGNIGGLEELAYPLCQITISLMKLFPSIKYLALRLHCLRILLIMQHNCELYVPTLALATELLTDVLLLSKKKPTKGQGTHKNIDMKCFLKISTAHLDDVGFRQAALEELFSIQLEAAHAIQENCAFADIIVPVNQKIREFVKSCRNVEFSRLFRSLEIKLKEQSIYTRKIIDSTDVDLRNEALMKHLGRRFKTTDAPLTRFYNSWQNIWKLKQSNASNAVIFSSIYMSIPTYSNH